jgi:hypothetical protein
MIYKVFQGTIQALQRKKQNQELQISYAANWLLGICNSKACVDM